MNLLQLPLEIISYIFHLIDDRKSQRNFLSMCKFINQITPETRYFNLRNRFILERRPDILVSNISRITVLLLDVSLLTDPNLFRHFHSGFSFKLFTNLQEITLNNSSLETLVWHVDISSMRLKRLHIISKGPCLLVKWLNITDSKIKQVMLQNVFCQALLKNTHMKTLKLVDSVMCSLNEIKEPLLFVRSLEIRSSDKIFQDKTQFTVTNYKISNTNVELMFKRSEEYKTISNIIPMLTFLKICSPSTLEYVHFEGYVNRREAQIDIKDFEKLMTMKLSLSVYDRNKESRTFFFIRLIGDNTNEMLVFY